MFLSFRGVLEHSVHCFIQKGGWRKLLGKRNKGVYLNEYWKMHWILTQINDTSLLGNKGMVEWLVNCFFKFLEGQIWKPAITYIRDTSLTNNNRDERSLNLLVSTGVRRNSVYEWSGFCHWKKSIELGFPLFFCHFLGNFWQFFGFSPFWALAPTGDEVL